MVKSLQGASVREVESRYTGRCQCDASDKREVTLPNGIRLSTTNLVVGGFDLLAVNIFQFDKTWRFAVSVQAFHKMLGLWRAGRVDVGV